MMDTLCRAQTPPPLQTSSYNVHPAVINLTLPTNYSIKTTALYTASSHALKTTNSVSKLNKKSYPVCGVSITNTKLQIKKPLIVLDLNGVLCFRSRIHPNSNFDHLGLECFKIRDKMIYIRPFAREFIKYCLKYYQLGFFTSTTKKNAYPILKRLISPEDWSSVKFFWYRKQTDPDPDIGKNPLTRKYSTIKLIEPILKSPYINCNYQDIIICDDTEQKLRFIPESNKIIVKSFDLTEYLHCKKTSKVVDGELIQLCYALYRRIYGISSPNIINSRCHSIA